MGVPIPSETASRLVAYLKALLELNETVNLTAIRDLGDGIRRHLLDSLAGGLHAAEFGSIPRRVLDLGTGGGFPGIPLAALWPASDVVLMDSTRKKVDAVRRTAETAHIPVILRWARAEELALAGDPLLNSFDLVVTRAVAPLPRVISLAAPFLGRSGCVVSWKSQSLSDEERRTGDAMATRLKLKRLPDIDYDSGLPAKLIRYQRAT